MSSQGTSKLVWKPKVPQAGTPSISASTHLASTGSRTGQPSTSELLQKLVKEQELGALAEIETTKEVKSIKRIDQIRFYSFLLFWLGLLTYALTVYYSVSTRYKFMIDEINKVIAKGGYNRTSAFFIALAYDYPLIGRWRFVNPSFPAAVVYSYYSKTFSKQMLANQDTYLHNMLITSEQGGKNIGGGEFPSARAIICTTFGYREGDKVCENTCKGPGKASAQEYVGSAASFGMQGAFLGTMFAPGLGTGIGALVGGLVGGGLTLWKSLSAQAQCEKSKVHCIPIAAHQC